MKSSGVVVITFLIVLIPALIISCASTRQATTEAEFYTYWTGTWISTDLHRSYWTRLKVVNKPDGTQDRYTAPDMPKACTHPYVFKDVWKDSKGNIWYKATSECLITPDTPIQEYGKVSVIENTYELIYTLSNDPIEVWEPDNPLYFHLIYNRSD